MPTVTLMSHERVVTIYETQALEARPEIGREIPIFMIVETTGVCHVDTPPKFRILEWISRQSIAPLE